MVLLVQAIENFANSHLLAISKIELRRRLQ
jgi:hypothetical protein